MNTDNKPALALAIVGNTLNLAYNIPFVYLVWQKRSSKNISGTFLALRFWGSITWLIYAILVMDAWVGFSYVVTLTATCAIYYIKFKERKAKNQENNQDCDDINENQNEINQNEINQNEITTIVRSSSI